MNDAGNFSKTNPNKPNLKIEAFLGPATANGKQQPERSFCRLLEMLKN